MKILHTADWHLRDSDINECRKVTWALVGSAGRRDPDLIIIAGDIFHSRNTGMESESAKLAFDRIARLADIAPVVILIGTPSHDGLCIEIARYIGSTNPVHVSTIPEQLYFTVAGELWTGPPPDDLKEAISAVITCIPQPTKKYFQSLGSIAETDQQISDAMTAMYAGFGAEAKSYQCPHILVGHFQVGGAVVSSGQNLIGRDIEISKAQLESASADLICLGQIHKGQQIGSNIFYSGSIYRLTCGEPEPKGFYLHEIDIMGAATDEPHFNVHPRFIELPARKIVKFGIDLVNDIDAPPVTELIEGADLQIEIQVFEDEAEVIDKEDIIKTYMDDGAASVDVRVIRIPRDNVRSKQIIRLVTLREKLIERAALNQEQISESILAKADLLESEPEEKILSAL